MKKSFHENWKIYSLSFLFVLLFILSISYIFFNDHLFLNEVILKLSDKHIVKIETNGDVDLTKVSIKWTTELGEKFIFKNGKKASKIGYICGDYGFSVYYKDSLINHFGHYNSRWDNINHYNFKVSNNNHTVTSSLIVIGPDSISKSYWDELLHPYTQDQLKVQKCGLTDIFSKNNFQKNLIEVAMNPDDYSKIEKNINSKFPLKKASIRINNKSLELKKIKIAGASTLNYRRKSYKISLEKPFAFKDNDTTLQIQDFRLLSLSMDPYYYNMYISYRFMRELNLFDLYFTYVELCINDETQGLYLLVEEPEHYILKRKENNFMIRRNYNYSSFLNAIVDNDFEYKSDIKKSTLANADYIESFKQIYKILNKYQGKELYNELNKYIDFNQYTKWMAINYLLLNGDYTDEVYFYSKAAAGIARFEIVPWDYDDILRLPPHEGWNYRHAKIGNKLIYSVEDSLDLKIASDEYLYAQYLNSLNQVISTINDHLIKRVLEDACFNVRHYMKDKKILSVSRYDKTPVMNEDDVITNLKASHLFLLERRQIISGKLNKMNSLVDASIENNQDMERLNIQNN